MEPVLFYKSLADSTRLTCLLLLQQEGELCVCDLMAALGESQPKVSRHLAQLRRNAILLDRRQGQWVYYQINPLLPNWAINVLNETIQSAPPFLGQAQQKLALLRAKPSHTTTLC